MTTTTPTESPRTVHVTGAQIAAARVRVLTDEKLGLTTPPVIVQLAQTR